MSRIIFLLVLTFVTASCEIDTRLSVEGGNPPAFVMSGNGSLGRLVVPILYGEVPSGYVQVYPEQGGAAPLLEGETYDIQVDTSNANGASGYVKIRNGEVLFANDEHELRGR